MVERNTTDKRDKKRAGGFELAGWDIVDPRRDGDAPKTYQADKLGSNMTALKDKYAADDVGDAPAAAGAPYEQAAESDPAQQSEWIRLRPSSATDANVGIKTALVDKETRRVKAVQG